MTSDAATFHVFWITTVWLCGAFLLLWILSLAMRRADVVDPWWPFGFAFIAWISVGYAPEKTQLTARSLICACCTTLWSLRLGVHLLTRNFAPGHGEDYRYAEMRKHWGRGFPIVSLFTVFTLQGLIMWAVSMPLQVAITNGSNHLNGFDIAAIIVFFIGFVGEAVADQQLKNHRANLAMKGKVLDTGLWRYCRHPNYFHNAVIWWGLTLFCMATDIEWRWAMFFSPILMTFLLRMVSGVTLLEQNMIKNKVGYKEYVQRTNALFPWFPKSLPQAVNAASTYKQSSLLSTGKERQMYPYNATADAFSASADVQNNS